MLTQHYERLTNDEVRRLVENSPRDQLAALPVLLERLPDEGDDYNTGYEAGCKEGETVGRDEAVEDIAERINEALPEGVSDVEETVADIVGQTLKGYDARLVLGDALHAAGIDSEADPQELIDWIAERRKG